MVLVWDGAGIGWCWYRMVLAQECVGTERKVLVKLKFSWLLSCHGSVTLLTMFWLRWLVREWNDLGLMEWMVSPDSIIIRCCHKEIMEMSDGDGLIMVVEDGEFGEMGDEGMERKEGKEERERER